MLKKLLFAAVALAFTANVAWAEKTITFAADCTWPPMEMLDADKNIVGFAPDPAGGHGQSRRLHARDQEHSLGRHLRRAGLGQIRRHLLFCLHHRRTQESNEFQ